MQLLQYAIVSQSLSRADNSHLSEEDFKTDAAR